MTLTRHAFSDKLLIACYEKTVKNIISCITSKKYLTFNINIISNIRKKQIQNCCIVIKD